MPKPTFCLTPAMVNKLHKPSAHMPSHPCRPIGPLTTCGIGQYRETNDQNPNASTPDDWHLYLRGGAMLQAVASYSNRFRPRHHHAHLVPPVVTGARRAYRDRIRAALDAKVTLTSTDDALSGPKPPIRRISSIRMPSASSRRSNCIRRRDDQFRLGVRDFDSVRPALEAMAEAGVRSAFMAR